jgi:Zn-dependent protease
MSSAGNHDDPLERLAAEEDWQHRARAVEDEVAKARLRKRLTPGRPSAGRRERGHRGGISKIFLGLLALTAVSGWTLWAGIGPAAVSVFVFVLSGWLVTLCLHEFFHAYTAHRGGDDSVAGKGYLNLDPRKYGHPVLTLLIPLIVLVIGGIPLPGGAVMIESHRLRNRFRDALVSAAGPAVNIVAAIVLLIVVSTAGPDFIVSLEQPHAAFWAGLTFLAYLQVATAILNLMPVPGLDGWGIIDPYLPDSARRAGDKVKPYGFILLFLLLMLPPFRSAFGFACAFFLDLAQAPINGVYFGYDLFRFWG